MGGTGHERWICSAVAYIERHLTDDVNFDDAARHTAVSRFHLHRVFQRQLGYSAASSLRERRLARPAANLIRTNKRILDIASPGRTPSRALYTIVLDVSEQTEANPALAWLSLVVAYRIIIGSGCLHLLFVGAY